MSSPKKQCGPRSSTSQGRQNVAAPSKLNDNKARVARAPKPSTAQLLARLHPRDRDRLLRRMNELAALNRLLREPGSLAVPEVA
ncbi:hypothetical protein ACIBG8_44450 [Nonomuraea sp. NPDC050556]|uniref:hypothetical protein n=1 Tax=Nonomuraea sp. NPDC050556 TaxID=3364369 RepID=UPI0037AFFC90